MQHYVHCAYITTAWPSAHRCGYVQPEEQRVQLAHNVHQRKALGQLELRDLVKGLRRAGLRVAI